MTGNSRDPCTSPRNPWLAEKIFAATRIDTLGPPDFSLKEPVNLTLTQVDAVRGVPIEKAFGVIEVVQSLGIKILGTVGYENDGFAILDCHGFIYGSVSG